jgi:Gamma-glutamyl cyclotransferase, AIG2-like
MTTNRKKVWVFFYGTFMNVRVLAEHGVTVSQSIPARLSGVELMIRPRVNLVVSDRSCAYGGLVSITHEDLAQLYRDLADRFGLTYVPEAVLAETRDGLVRPALCYFADEMPEAAADPGYVRQLAQCVRDLGHPEWYALHVESFGTT